MEWRPASLTGAGANLLRWFMHEFLLPTPPACAGARLANVCRPAGCAVILASLCAELQAGLLPNVAAAAIQLGLAGLTAILFGNIAKEVAFDIAARCTLWCGRPFVRQGVSVRGRTFWEIQFRDGTWLRYEMGATRAICEWTERDGRCSRLELQPLPRPEEEWRCSPQDSRAPSRAVHRRSRALSLKEPSGNLQ